MATAEEVIAEARSWVGTPYHHQAMLKGIGADCVGLIRGVSTNCGGPFDPLLWKRFENYSRTPNPRRMLEGMATFLVPVAKGDELQLADVLHLQWRGDMPMHLAFYATQDGRPTIIHALAAARRVCEHGFEPPWPGRVHAVWRLPIVAG
jgi:NlpC/P60 family putative phage cell wall peptidase